MAHCSDQRRKRTMCIRIPPGERQVSTHERATGTDPHPQLLKKVANERTVGYLNRSVIDSDLLLTARRPL